MLKKVFDFVVATTSLILLSPFLLLVALAIKVLDPGPVFYRQERVGQNSKPFKIWKFRTMVVSADRAGSLTVGDDPRITSIGSFLRKYKIDELPQLINIIIGEMSFVGPRPEVPKWVAKYNDQQKKVLELKPGITDPASIEYRNESDLLGEAENPDQVYENEIMPKKIAINLTYAEQSSFSYDLKVIFKTIFVSAKGS